MLFGFLLTGLCILFLVVLGLIEIRRVDRIIEKVDQDLGPPEEEEDRE